MKSHNPPDAPDSRLRCSRAPDGCSGPYQRCSRAPDVETGCSHAYAHSPGPPAFRHVTREGPCLPPPRGPGRGACRGAGGGVVLRLLKAALLHLHSVLHVTLVTYHII